jgi:hypothetical protein
VGSLANTQQFPAGPPFHLARAADTRTKRPCNTHLICHLSRWSLLLLLLFEGGMVANHKAIEQSIQHGEHARNNDHGVAILVGIRVV